MKYLSNIWNRIIGLPHSDIEKVSQYLPSSETNSVGQIQDPDSEWPDLREFVYLDEISVNSLLASLIGMLPREEVEKQKAKIQAGTAATLSGGIPGAGSMKVGLDASASNEEDYQVVRRAVIQGVFKALYDLVEKRLTLHKTQTPAELQNVKSFRELLDNASGLISPQQLERGHLFELEVELSTPSIFRVKTIFSATLGFTPLASQIFGNASQFAQLEAGVSVITSLLDGLVPIRGRAVDFQVVKTHEGEEWICPNHLLTTLDDPEIDIYPLIIVGVVEEALFWKNIRRVLFSESTYRVFCRVGKAGLQDSWTPVKLVEILRDVSPEMANVIESLGDNVMNEIQQSKPHQAPQNNKIDFAQKMETGIRVFGELLTKESQNDDAAIDAEINQLAKSLSKQPCQKFADVQVAFEKMEAHFKVNTGEILSADLIADLREQAQQKAGISSEIFLKMHQETVSMPYQDRRKEQDDEHAQYLDAEFIAIYW